jgi:hypothetical protein
METIPIEEFDVIEYVKVVIAIDEIDIDISLKVLVEG